MKILLISLILLLSGCGVCVEYPRYIEEYDRCETHSECELEEYDIMDYNNKKKSMIKKGCWHDQ